MSQIIEPLVLDLVEWVAKERRSHADVMDVWRTSCPRLTVWEDAVDRGLVERVRSGERGYDVLVTPSGHALLRANGRTVATRERADVRASGARDL